MKNQNKEIFASNLKQKIDQTGMTVKDFAKQLGFKYSTVLDWVNAKTYPRIDKIERIARYFGIDKSELIETNYTGLTQEDAPKKKMYDLADEEPLSYNGIELPEELKEYYKSMAQHFIDTKNRDKE